MLLFQKLRLTVAGTHKAINNRRKPDGTRLHSDMLRKEAVTERENLERDKRQVSFLSDSLPSLYRPLTKCVTTLEKCTTSS